MSVLVVAVSITAIVFFIDKLYPSSRSRPVVVRDDLRARGRSKRLANERR